MHAQRHRTDEGQGEDAAIPSRTDPQLLPRKEGVILGSRRRPKHESETGDEKSVRVSPVQDHSDRAVSYTWPPARARTHPQSYLKRPIMSSRGDSLDRGRDGRWRAMRSGAVLQCPSSASTLTSSDFLNAAKLKMKDSRRPPHSHALSVSTIARRRRRYFDTSSTRSLQR